MIKDSLAPKANQGYWKAIACYETFVVIQTGF